MGSPIDRGEESRDNDMEVGWRLIKGRISEERRIRIRKKISLHVSQPHEYAKTDVLQLQKSLQSSMYKLPHNVNFDKAAMKEDMQDILKERYGAQVSEIKKETKEAQGSFLCSASELVTETIPSKTPREEMILELSDKMECDAMNVDTMLDIYQKYCPRDKNYLVGPRVKRYINELCQFFDVPLLAINTVTKVQGCTSYIEWGFANICEKFCPHAKEALRDPSMIYAPPMDERLWLYDGDINAFSTDDVEDNEGEREGEDNEVAGRGSLMTGGGRSSTTTTTSMIMGRDKNEEDTFDEHVSFEAAIRAQANRRKSRLSIRGSGDSSNAFHASPSPRDARTTSARSPRDRPTEEPSPTCRSSERRPFDEYSHAYFHDRAKQELKRTRDVSKLKAYSELIFGGVGGFGNLYPPAPSSLLNPTTSSSNPCANVGKRVTKSVVPGISGAPTIPKRQWPRRHSSLERSPG